jgi:hypothetical protein
LSKALANIAEVLPRIRLDGSLYPTQHMREAISRIYAHIILFLQRAVKWYTQGPARRAISSILKPYQLNYRDTIDEIKACTATVDAIASASARAETRGQSIAIEEQSERLKETDIKLHSLQQHLLNLQASSQRTEAQVTQMLLLATSQCLACRNVSVADFDRSLRSHTHHQTGRDRFKGSHLRYPIFTYSRRPLGLRPKSRRRLSELSVSCKKTPILAITWQRICFLHTTPQGLGFNFRLCYIYYRSWFTR